MNSTPATGSMGSRSSAMMRPSTTPPGPARRSRATCDQLPGAEPRSTTTSPRRISFSASRISSSLKAARAR
ncbi:Uncharacterised protein [Bordetella pertussis]|nr:Uncharacterised protein [Bordetella pertussis]